MQECKNGNLACVVGISHLSNFSYVKFCEKCFGVTGFLRNKLLSSKNDLKVEASMEGSIHPGLKAQGPGLSLVSSCVSISGKTLHAQIGTLCVSRIAVVPALKFNEVATLLMHLLCAWRI